MRRLPSTTLVTDSDSRGPARTSHRGFSLIELLIVMVIIGTLAKIAIPNFTTVRRKAEAADIVGSFDVVRVAAYTYHADNNSWPPDANEGEVPPGMENYLPDGFTFTENGNQLEWEYWELPDGLPGHENANIIIGVSLVTADADFGNEVMNLLGGGYVTYSVGDHYTYLFGEF